MVNRMGKIFGIIVMIIISFSSIVVCSAMDKKDVTDEGILLVVADESRETYGLQLKNEVYTQLEKQLKIAICKDSESQEKITNYSFGEISKAEKPELLALAAKTGVNKVLVVEILPTKSDFSEILFYQSIKSEATIKVRLYDAVAQQYVLTEEIRSTGLNKTIIPYTFVGKKGTVVEAVQKATTIVAQRVNQTLANYK